jgi:hypothetical protein
MVFANPFIKLVPGAGIEPARCITPRDFKSLASTNSATQASQCFWMQNMRNEHIRRVRQLIAGIQRKVKKMT